MHLGSELLSGQKALSSSNMICAESCKIRIKSHSPQFGFVQSVQSCPTLCDPMDCRTPGLPVHHQLPGAYSNSSPSSP